VGGDFLVTGVDEKGNEKLIYFLTKCNRKGTEVFGEILLDKPKEYVFNLLGTPIISHESNYYYNRYKDGYNIIIQVNDNGDVWQIYIFKSEEKISFKKHFDLNDKLFYPNNKIDDSESE